MNDENPYQSPESFSEKLDADNSRDDSQPEVLQDSFSLVTSCGSLSEAQLYQSLLSQHGIESHLENATDLGAAYSAALGGIKVFVKASELGEAVQYLANGLAELPTPEALGDITFDCEDCGAQITFPGDRRGKTETCPKCHEYVDVPD